MSLYSNSGSLELEREPLLEPFLDKLRLGGRLSGSGVPPGDLLFLRTLRDRDREEEDLVRNESSSMDVAVEFDR